MGKTLILTEKPSQARDFAKALKNCKQNNGYFDCGEYIITWAFGHLFEIDDGIAPKEWKLEDLPIFPLHQWCILPLRGTFV
jgi:DNA topoisomerase-3